MRRAMLKRAGILTLLASTLTAVAALPATAAPEGSFDSLVAGIQHEFSIRGRRVPMLGFASCLARVFTWGGVKGIRLAEFDNVGNDLNADALESVIRRKLGKSWHSFVINRDQESGETTFVYERPSHGSMSLMIADLDGDELSLIQVKLSEKRLIAWLNHPRASLKSSKNTR